MFQRHAELPAGTPQRAIAQSILSGQPKLSWTESFYWRLFDILSTERHPSMTGVSPIPYSRIRAEAKEWDFDEQEQDDFKLIMRKVDAAFVSIMAAKGDKEMASAERKTRSV